MKDVFGIPTVDRLKGFYDRLASTGGIVPGSGALLDSLRFSNDLSGCRASGDVSADGSCRWSTLGSATSAQSAGFERVGYTQSATNLASGFERPIGNGHTSVGAALHFSSGTLADSTNGATFSGSSLAAGVSARHILRDGTALSASLAGGAGSYTTARNISYPQLLTQANGKQSIVSLGLHVRAEHRYGTARNAATPFVDLGSTRIAAGALNESGAGAFNEHIGATATTFSTVRSGVTIDTERRLGAGTSLHATLDLSATQLLGTTRLSAPAVLEGAPGSVNAFVVTNALDRTRFTLGPSLTLPQKDRLAVRVGAGYDFSASSHNVGAYISIGKKL
jgi:hypothetical protein